MSRQYLSKLARFAQSNPSKSAIIDYKSSYSYLDLLTASQNYANSRIRQNLPDIKSSKT